MRTAFSFFRSFMSAVGGDEFCISVFCFGDTIARLP